MPKTPLAFLFCILFLHPRLNAQSPEKALEFVRDNYTKESIYIHFAKENYIAGETIWFKAYLMAGVAPSLYSTALNVELLNDSGRVVSKKILPVLGSAASGNFDLKKDAPQTNYTIRAFTKRMMNFGSEEYYEHELQVFNAGDSSRPAEKTAGNRLYFFPEAGYLIAGIPNVVAFKSSDNYGYPKDCNGVVLNSKGNAIVNFNSVHDGMGKFIFIPEAGETYSALCIIDGQQSKESLPSLKVSGTGFQLQRAPEKEYYIINKEKLANPAMAPAYLLGIMENTVLFKQPLPADDPVIKGELSLQQFPSGILQLTLFTKDDLPVAERMIFVNNNDFLIKGIFNPDTVSTNAREKNLYTFTLEDTLPGTFSVAVTDCSKELPAQSRENIVSRFLLQNDIRGYVHNPLYYFSGNDEERKNNLDLVMLTSGWRRFNWDQVLNNKLPLISYKDENYISLTGKVYADNSSKLLSNTNMYAFIMTKDSASDFMTVTIDSSGIFKMPGMIFNDTASVSFQQVGKKIKTVSVSLYTPSLSKQFSYVPGNSSRFMALQKKDSITTTTVKKIYQSMLEAEKDRSILLQNIMVTSKKTKTEIVQDRYAKGMFSGKSSFVIDLLSEPLKNVTYRNVFEYMKMNTYGVLVAGTGMEYYVIIKGATFDDRIAARLFVDGEEAPSYYISTVPIEDIALIKIYGTGYIGTLSDNRGGDIAIFTRKAQDTRITPGSGLNKLRIEGFAPVKEFFSPDYSTRKEDGLTDVRTTLYWNPYIVTNAQNKIIRIPFFNSDEAKKFRVILTGMNAEGKLLYVEKVIE